MGGGGGHPDPEIRGGGGRRSQEKFFRPFRPQFGLKIEGGSSPGSTVVSKKYPVLIFQRFTRC